MARFSLVTLRYMLLCHSLICLLKIVSNNLHQIWQKNALSHADVHANLVLFVIKCSQKFIIYGCILSNFQHESLHNAATCGIVFSVTSLNKWFSRNKNMVATCGFAFVVRLLNSLNSFVSLMKKTHAEVFLAKTFE